MKESINTYTDPPEWLAIGDVARVLDVSVATVRNWERAGKITAIRTPGGQRRFKRADVDRLISH